MPVDLSEVKQPIKDIIIEFLVATPEMGYTGEEIAEGINLMDNLFCFSRQTVFRRLKEMVEDGVVKHGHKPHLRKRYYYLSDRYLNNLM